MSKTHALLGFYSRNPNEIRMHRFIVTFNLKKLFTIVENIIQYIGSIQLRLMVLKKIQFDGYYTDSTKKWFSTLNLYLRVQMIASRYSETFLQKKYEASHFIWY